MKQNYYPHVEVYTYLKYKFLSSDMYLIPKKLSTSMADGGRGV